MGPDKILEKMAETFRERHEIYGDNYLMIGHVMKELFPDGASITTVNEWNRFHVLFMMVVKMTRLACTGIYHKDSAHDIGVYAAMLESLFPEEKIVTELSDIENEDIRIRNEEIRKRLQDRLKEIEKDKE